MCGFGVKLIGTKVRKRMETQFDNLYRPGGMCVLDVRYAEPFLTLVIQLMAATLAGRDIQLFTSGDRGQGWVKDDLYRDGRKGGQEVAWLPLLAMEACSRNLGNILLTTPVYRLHTFLLEEKVKVCDLVSIVANFRWGFRPQHNLFNHIEGSVWGCFEDADENKKIKRKSAKKCCSLS